MYKYTFGDLQVYFLTRFKYFEIILKTLMIIINGTITYAARSWG